MTPKQVRAVFLSTIMVTSMIVVFLAFSGVGSVIAAEEGDDLSPGPVNTTGSITQPGVYYLTEDIDLTDLNVTAFEITSSDVELDGRGHIIYGNDVENSSAVYVHTGGAGLSNVTIKNLGVRDLDGGIVFFNVDDVTVTGNTLTSNGGEILKLTNVAGGTIADNTITRNGGETVKLMNVQDGTLTDNTISDNGGEAIVLANSGGPAGTTRTVIADNAITDNAGDGIAVRQGVTDTAITNNDISRNTGKALFFMSADGNTIVGNTIADNTGDKAIHLTGGSDDNVLRDNVIANNAGEQAVHFGSSKRNTVVGNKIYGSEGHGITFGDGPNTVTDNVINDNGADASIPQYYGSAGFNVENAESANTFADNDLYGNGVGIRVAAGATATLSGDRVHDNLKWDVLTDEGGIVSGDAVTIDEAAPVVISLEATDVGITGVDAPPAPPADRNDLGKYLEAGAINATASLHVQVHYTQADLTSSGADEETLHMWRFDDSDWRVVGASDGEFTYDYTLGEWVTDTSGETGVNTSEDYVWADVTTFDANGTVFAPVDGPASNPDIDITATSMTPNPAGTSETVTVSATVENAGDLDATVWLDLLVDGVVVETTSVVVAGQSSTTATFERQFDLGEFDVGVSGTTVGTLIVYDDVPPVADAGGDRVVGVNQTVTFDGSGSTDDSGVIASYAWEFGDGSSATGAVVDHVYTTVNQTYTVSLTVTDEAGNSDTDTATVEVVPDAPPVADAGDDLTVAVGELIAFDGSGSFDYEGPVTGYEWDFGDGSSATGAEVSHVYDATGTYTVTLTVMDEAGQTGTDTATVEVVPDADAPVAVAGPDRTITAGQSVTFDGSGSTDNVGIESYAWEFGDGGSATGITVSHTYPTVGTYTVTLTVRDAAGNVDTDTAVVTVQADTSDDGGTSPPPSGGGSSSPPADYSSSSTSTGGAATTPSGPQVDVSEDGNQAQVNVQNAGAGDTIRVRFQFQDGEACSNLEQLSVRSRVRQSFQLQVGQSTEAPEGVPAWQMRAGEPAFGYLSVDHDGQLDTGEFTFRVRTACLDDGDVDPSQLRLYRYQDGEWVALQTRLVEQTETHLRYTARTPGFSVFAVGVAETDITVTGASLESATIATGEQASVRVTLRNAGDLAGSYTVDLVADGVVLESVEVTMPADRTATITMTHLFEEAGEYTISVDGITAGTLVVESLVGTATPAEDTPAADPGEGDDGGIAPIVIGLLALAALVIVVVFFLTGRGGGRV